VSVQDYAAIVVAICTVVAAFTGMIQWLVKHYLAELKPNGGGSLSDRLARVESQIDQIYQSLMQK
jgi:ammonia channel protein AmtB